MNLGGRHFIFTAFLPLTVALDSTMPPAVGLVIDLLISVLGIA
jgi:hypothetical protein